MRVSRSTCLHCLDAVQSDAALKDCPSFSSSLLYLSVQGTVSRLRQLLPLTVLSLTCQPGVDSGKMRELLAIAASGYCLWRRWAQASCYWGLTDLA